LAHLSSRHLVDPQLLGLLDSLPTLALSTENLPLVRAGSRLPSPGTREPAVEVRHAIQRVPGPAGAPEVALYLYQPQTGSDARPCIYHVHGGGYVLGTPETQRDAHRWMAAELGCCIVSVDYRLAPETPFPGPVEDCYAGLAWVTAHAAELGIDPARIGVMGESAGGGLAAALALMVRDRGELRLAFQHLIYPMIDDRTCVAGDPNPYVGEFLWTPHNNHFGWKSLLGQEPGGEGVSPYAAAARATDLAGLPPTFISTGSLDLFLEEDLDYAQRLLRAGVPVELHVYPGGFHAFDIDPAAAVSAQARRDSRAALARALTG
jgi:triacylglycerol lipase